MSHSLGLTPRTVRAMDIDVPPQRINSLGNKIFHTHADFRVDSVEDVTQAVGQSSSTGALLEAGSTTVDTDDEKKRAATMRMWWDEAMAKHMVLSEGYSRVAVLIIKWADELDDLRTKDEAQELEHVFRDHFRYEIETVELNIIKGKKPQLQLNSRISSFAEEYDGPNNLLIVYYTGHGVYCDDEDYLQLTACMNPIQGKCFQKDAVANWDKAEQILKAEEVDADVLTILDTCYSSNIAKGAKQSIRKFELLSACPHDQTTSSPGDKSFTRVLIDKLKEFADEYEDKPFSTVHLSSRINMDKRRHDTPSQLWPRLPNEQNILLAPMKPKGKQVPQKTHVQLEPRGYLTLRFALKEESLNRQQIEYLTKNLSKAFANKELIGLKKIDWLGIRPRKISPFERVALAAFAITQWKKAMQRRKEKRLGEAAGTSTTPMELDTNGNSAPASPRRKRSLDAEDEFPANKRRTTDTSQPPPSPVSISSHSHEDL